jgi:hypothetical protein
MTTNDPPIYRFTDWLAAHDGGTLDLELGDSLRQLVDTCGRVDKVGAVTLKVKLDPRGNGAGFEVYADVALALPKEPVTASFYFATGDGRLTKYHPNQPQLPMEATHDH